MPAHYHVMRGNEKDYEDTVMKKNEAVVNLQITNWPKGTCYYKL